MDSVHFLATLLFVYLSSDFVFHILSILIVVSYILCTVFIKLLSVSFLYKYFRTFSVCKLSIRFFPSLLHKYIIFPLLLKFGSCLRTKIQTRYISWFQILHAHLRMTQRFHSQFLFCKSFMYLVVYIMIYHYSYQIWRNLFFLQTVQIVWMATITESPGIIFDFHSI